VFVRGGGVGGEEEFEVLEEAVGGGGVEAEEGIEAGGIEA
jgi:hypothetical protein